MLRLNKRLYLVSTGETRVLLILLRVKAVLYKTISCKDNKAYKLASPNNKSTRQ